MRALTALGNLEHRGAEGADARHGRRRGHDLCSSPMRCSAPRSAPTLPPLGRYGVAVCFLPRDDARADELERLLAETVEAEGQSVVAWRDVPGRPAPRRRVGRRDRAANPAALRRGGAGA